MRLKRCSEPRSIISHDGSSNFDDQRVSGLPSTALAALVPSFSSPLDSTLRPCARLASGAAGAKVTAMLWAAVTLLNV